MEPGLFNQLFLSGILSGAQYGLIAVSFAVIYKAVRFFHFAHGAVLTVGAYTAYGCITMLHWPIAAAFIAALLISASVGVLIDRFVYRPLRERKAPNLVFLVASFGVFILIQNLIQIAFGAETLALGAADGKRAVELFGSVATNTQITSFFACIIFSLLTWMLLRYSNLGRAIRAVADDRLAASLVGIYSERIILFTFAIGSALAAVAGVLIAVETNLEPTMGMNAILKGMTAAVVGGIGTISGAIVGGLFVGLAENLGVYAIPTGWKDSISFGLLILFLLLRPQGILGQSLSRE